MGTLISTVIATFMSIPNASFLFSWSLASAYTAWQNSILFPLTTSHQSKRAPLLSFCASFELFVICDRLAYGALLSAVDPVATLSILGSKRMNAGQNEPHNCDCQCLHAVFADPILYSII